MKLLLRTDVKHVGVKGETVDVPVALADALISAGQAHLAGATVPAYPASNVRLLADGTVEVTEADGTITIYTADALLAALQAGYRADTVPTMEAAMAGDMVLTITPATVNRAATAAAWTRTVTIQLETAAGEVHTWYNADLAVAIATTSVAGTASITDATPPMVAGVCQVVVSGDAAAWLAVETDTLTLSDQTIMGNVVAGGTSVQTFT